MDALLGAAALGDIGRHFPDTDNAYAGADSMVLLQRVVALLAEKGYRPAEVDVTIIAEAPKLSQFITDMCSNLAIVLGISLDCVSVKATTSEGMNDEGKGLCISAQAIASIC
jgi:2-C-methyl-D-erythritol 2,4-cyclodiphosphate synthase